MNVETLAPPAKTGASDQVVAAVSLRRPSRTAAMVASTAVVVMALMAGPIVLVWWAARSFERSGYLFIDLVFAVAVVTSFIAWLRALRPEASVKRIVVLPVSVQRAGRDLFERSAFGAGAMTEWTSVDPEAGLSLIQSPDSTSGTDDDADVGDDIPPGRPLGPRRTFDIAGAVTRPTDPVSSTRPRFDDVVVHTTARGESFWSLAEQLLGDGKRWAELRDLNVGREVADGVVLSETDGLNAGYRIVVPATEGAKSNVES